jgi:hypothetical protein
MEENQGLVIYYLAADPKGWFDVGTYVILIQDYLEFGLFCGMHNGQIDEEICPFNEFLLVAA